MNARYYQERITILSTADIHGHIVYDEETGGYYTLDEVSVMVGMPLMKHIIDEVRNENKNTLLLDSGDLFHGTNEANIEKGKGVVEVANLRGYDAMTPGNHDFNSGFDRLLEIRGQHLGDDDDRELVKKVDGIDLILYGHHHFLYEKADKVNNTYLVDSGGYSTHVGQADMYFKDGKLAKLDWTPKNIKDKSKADPVLDAVALKYHSIAFESAKEVVAKTKDKLDGFRSNIRTKETTLADLLTDAMRETGEADIALMNGGGIRESIPAGKRLVIITTSDGSALDKDKYYKVATNITFTTAETAMRN